MELFEEPSIFPISYTEIIQRVQSIDPVKYASTRNYLNGSVTFLSPYISRGIISTQYILKSVLDRGYQPAHIEKFIQELAWRDYWQQVWMSKGDAINNDLKHTQIPVSNQGISQSIVAGNTGINAVDSAIATFYETGYLHNHMRMYIASLACNIAQSHWKTPAQWMYYHLLDADWASNALSWQWVAGSNANKKYVANQQNINKYCFTDQKNTFLDIPYAAFDNLPIPEILQGTSDVILTTPLPEPKSMVIDPTIPTCIYNFYNLDPLWRNNSPSNRVLLLEPSHFDTYPISKKTLEFIFSISEENIDGIQVFVGEYEDLINSYSFGNIYYKEHPLNTHYLGIEDSRDWMFEVKGYYPSFFAFWKKCKKELSY